LYTAFALCYRALALSHERRVCRELLDEAAELRKDLGDDASFELFMLSFVSFSAHDFARARQYVSQSRLGFERLGLRGSLAMCQVHLAAYSLAPGEAEATRLAARESTRSGAQHEPDGVPVPADGAALASQCRSSSRQRATGSTPAGGRAARTRPIGMDPRTSGAVPQRAETSAAIRLALGRDEDQLPVLMAEGRAWSLERAIDEALLV
jgi:hypothetical protein